MEKSPETERERAIVRASAVGIAANVALAALKAAVGILSNSIAVVLDAVNNLTDALSSVITIAGTKLASRPADRKHPMGHGRTEYLSAFVIAVIILYAGVTALVESAKKIASPATPEYAGAGIAIISVAVAVKVALGLFVKATGERANSPSLVASGRDALMDAVISAATVAAALAFVFFGVSLEAWLGAVISLLIIRTGLETLGETISKIIGERIDGTLSKDVKRTIFGADPEICGAFDLVLNNYGPDRLLGSAHIEVPDTWTADRIDSVSRKIAAEVYERHRVIMTAIGVYSVNTRGRAAQIRSEVSRIVHEHRDVLQMHGFYVDEGAKSMRFDIIVSFDSPDMQTMFNHVVSDVREAFPEYDVQAQFDTDVSD